MSVAPGTCDQCRMTGLPILPVRYTVIPKTVRLGLPPWASGDRVTSVDLGDDFKYAVRTVRTGFIYLFYEKHARGNRYWECYSVSQDGCVHQQPTTQAAQPYPSAQLNCGNGAHQANARDFLVIEQPEKCGPTWIAFSQDKWSEETVKEYTANTRLRNARMQTIHPAQMIGGAKHSHGALATEEALQGVLEYAEILNTHELPHDPPRYPGSSAVDELSAENGEHDRQSLRQMSTRYPWALRQGRAKPTAALMAARAKAAGGKPGTAHVLALWDAVGIAHELNGFRSDAAGWIVKYGDERALQMSAIQSYDGIQKALEQQAEAAADQRIAHVQSLPLLTAREDRARALLRANPNDAWARRELAEALAERQERAAASARGAQAFRQSQVAAAWPRYQGRLDHGPLQTFKQKMEAFHTDAADLVERRTQPLVRWLEDRLFLDTLNDYHGRDLEDGFLFEYAVAEALFGIGSSPSGRRKIEAWVKEAKASVEANLLWRVVALNQDEARAELDAALAEAERHKAQRSEASALATTGYLAKSLKAFADTYKKAQGVFDGNAKASSEAGSIVFGSRLKPINMRGVDKFLITVGDAVFRHFRIDALADCASEKIIQHIFGLRAFVNAADSTNLILAQAREDGLKRADTLKRLRTSRSFMAADTPEVRSAQSEMLGEAWRRFKADTSTEAKAAAVASATKDARLAVVVGLIEGVNFAKLMADCKNRNDMKSWLSLLASGMSIASALFDVGTVAAKNLAGMGTASWTYQGLKLWGGVLSGGATFVGAYLDWEDAAKSNGKGHEALYWLFKTKWALGLFTGALTFATTFTYAAPLISRLTGRAIVGTAVQAVGKRAAAVIGFRILGMAVGMWATVGLFGLQFAIWIATPNALEDWIDHSAFGTKRATGGFKTDEEQEKKLLDALVEMGLQ